MTEKTPHYKNKSGKDLIDEWSENDEPIEVRAKIIGNLQKYCRRYGKKDEPLKEAIKLADYANRLLQYEKDLSNNVSVEELNAASDRFFGEV